MHVCREGSAFEPALPKIMYHRRQDWGSARGSVGPSVDVHLAARAECFVLPGQFVTARLTKPTNGSRFLHWSVAQTGSVQIKFRIFSGQ